MGSQGCVQGKCGPLAEKRFSWPVQAKSGHGSTLPLARGLKIRIMLTRSVCSWRGRPDGVRPADRTGQAVFCCRKTSVDEVQRKTACPYRVCLRSARLRVGRGSQAVRRRRSMARARAPRPASAAYVEGSGTAAPTTCQVPRVPWPFQITTLPVALTAGNRLVKLE